MQKTSSVQLVFAQRLVKINYRRNMFKDYCVNVYKLSSGNHVLNCTWGRIGISEGSRGVRNQTFTEDIHGSSRNHAISAALNKILNKTQSNFVKTGNTEINTVPGVGPVTNTNNRDMLMYYQNSLNQYINNNNTESFFASEDSVQDDTPDEIQPEVEPQPEPAQQYQPDYSDVPEYTDDARSRLQRLVGSNLSLYTESQSKQYIVYEKLRSKDDPEDPNRNYLVIVYKDPSHPNLFVVNSKYGNRPVQCRGIYNNREDAVQITKVILDELLRKGFKREPCPVNVPSQEAEEIVVKEYQDVPEYTNDAREMLNRLMSSRNWYQKFLKIAS